MLFKINFWLSPRVGMKVDPSGLNHRLNKNYKPDVNDGDLVIEIC